MFALPGGGFVSSYSPFKVPSALYPCACLSAAAACASCKKFKLCSSGAMLLVIMRLSRSIIDCMSGGCRDGSTIICWTSGIVVNPPLTCCAKPFASMGLPSGIGPFTDSYVCLPKDAMLLSDKLGKSEAVCEKCGQRIYYYISI